MEKARLWLMMMAVSLMLASPWSCAILEATRPEAPRLDRETLKTWLSDPQVLILDVRQPHDWQDSDKKIKGAVRQDPNDFKTWAANLPKGEKIVLSRNNEGTSARVAQLLIEMGFPQVWALKGGWLEWEKAGYPTESK
ncbi:MAG: rhodanese-related (seleno)protein [Desulfobaccales bacterium]|jgi:rhodanese-related sulfurtransferase